ncbi:SHOCT domain-containing protein [Alicycliphilus denitrificans]|uniref:SHOCT domain-containing protein n=1 Tax=Alicycliphilus denitrificans TaxID=179636 RepID=UPI0038511ECD
MQFILFLLGLFAIGCVLYGVSAGVQIIQRGFSRLANTAHTSEANAPKQRLQTPPLPSELPTPSHGQRYLDELNELYGLYQNGALTREEFAQLKRHLLSLIAPPTTRSSQENP